MIERLNHLRQTQRVTIIRTSVNEDVAPEGNVRRRRTVTASVSTSPIDAEYRGNSPTDTFVIQIAITILGLAVLTFARHVWDQRNRRDEDY